MIFIADSIEEGQKHGKEMGAKQIFLSQKGAEEQEAQYAILNEVSVLPYDCVKNLEDIIGGIGEEKL
jgi:hypothetical protein